MPHARSSSKSNPTARLVFGARLSLAVIALVCLVAHPAEAERVKVAVLDGAPVYHWTDSPSVCSNDIDRALILRDFERQGFHLSGYFVNEAVQRAIDQNFGGDRKKLEAALRQRHETMADFRQFQAEEIIIQAMRRHTLAGEDGKPAIPEAKWLAQLRKGARVQMIKSEQKSH